MKKFISLILCGVLLLSGLPFYAQATDSKENEVSLETFSNQLNAMIEKYDYDSVTDGNEVNSINSFSICEDETEEPEEISTNGTDRLIVKAEGDIDTRDAVAYIEGYNDLHILQFDNGKSAEKALEYYENCKNVEYAQEDEINRITDFEILETASSPVTLPQPMIDDADTMGFTALRKKLEDNNVIYKRELTVAVIDTGIAYDHDLLKDRVDPNGFDAVNSTSCYDDNGHGTHVAGIIVANTLENVTIKPYKVLNNEGKGTDAQTVLGVEAAIADGVNVINMSFGRRGENPAMDEALAKAHKAGIILVAAAGNDGYNMDAIPFTPACCDNVITVMAYNAPMNMRMYFSNYGSMCETAAIGYQVTSSYLNNTWAIASGTSQASPYVAAAVTYLILDTPTITYNKIVDRIDQYEWLNGMYLEYILDEESQQTPTPVLSVESGEFDTEFYLEITCSDPEAFVFYMKNDSQAVYDYEEPIKITYDTVITAYAQRKGKTKSEEAIGTYTRLFLNEEEKYIINSAGVITHYLGENSSDNTEIIIPDTIKGITPTAIEASLFKEFTHLKSIVIPDSITSIRNNAFYLCSSLEYITARGVKELGNYAFYNCLNLKEFTGTNLVKIGDYAFYKTNLPYLYTLNVTYIGTGAFKYATSMQSIISENLNTLADSAFKESSVRYVELPNIAGVCANAFENCKDLETVIITNATYIQDYAFNGCTSLKEISSDKINGVGDNAFYGCTSLVTAAFPLLKYVDNNTFYNCTALKIFNSPIINTVGISSFENCTSLQNVNYQYLTKLSDYAFRGCTALKNVNLPTLETLGKDAFAGCSSLNEVWIKGDVTVEAGAFETDFTAEKVILDNAILIKDLPENIPTALPLSVTSIEDTDFENVIIYGSKGSFGETWANENNQMFIEITTDTAIFRNVTHYCESINDTLSFDVIGLNRIYQWYGNTKNSNTGGKFIKNATTSEFTPSSHTKIYDYYYCVVVCQDGSNPIMTITSDVCTFIPVITPLLSTTTVDLIKLSIKTSETKTKNIKDLIKFSGYTTHYATPSYSNGEENFYGTGSSVIVYLNGKPDSVFNVIVYGDLNGDSVCDVLDCVEIEKAANGHTTLSGNTFSAADMNNNNKLDSRDYQNAVNKALAQ